MSKDKVHGAKVRGHQAQAFRSVHWLPIASHKTHLISPATNCEDTREMSTKEAHPSLGVQSFILGVNHIGTLCLGVWVGVRGCYMQLSRTPGEPMNEWYPHVLFSTALPSSIDSCDGFFSGVDPSHTWSSCLPAAFYSPQHYCLV